MNALGGARCTETLGMDVADDIDAPNGYDASIINVSNLAWAPFAQVCHLGI